MKWQKLIPSIALILAGVITMSMRVVSGIDARWLRYAITRPDRYGGGTVSTPDGQMTVLHYSPLTYVIGALLIIAGAFMLYNELKEAKHANNQ